MSRKEWSDSRCVAWATKEPNDGKQQPGPLIKSQTIYLRSHTDGDQATFAWSLDGQKWKTTDWS